MNNRDESRTGESLLKHYAPVSQANWCNMSLAAGNLFLSHGCDPHEAHTRFEP